MESRHDDLSTLEPLVRAGNDEAAKQLRTALVPQVERMVRRVLRNGERTSPLGRAVWAYAERCEPTDRAAPQIARALCDQLIERMCPAAGATRLRSETVLF